MRASEREHALAAATERMISIFRIVGGLFGVGLTASGLVPHPPLEFGIEVVSLLLLSAVGVATLLWLRTDPPAAALRRVMVWTFTVDVVVLLAEVPLHAFAVLEAPSPALLVPLLGAVKFGYRAAWVGIVGVAAAFAVRAVLATTVYDGDIGISAASLTVLLAAIVGLMAAHLYETARAGREQADETAELAEHAQRRTAAVHAVLSDGVGGGVHAVAERLAVTVCRVLGSSGVRLTVARPDGEDVVCEVGEVRTDSDRVRSPVVYGEVQLGELEVVEPQRLRDDLEGIVAQLGLALHAARLLDHEAAIAERYRALDAMRSDFVTLTTHELRTPVACIVGATETLLGLGVYADDGPARELHELVARQSSRLERLVEDLSTIGRSDAGALVLAPRSTLVEDLVATVVLTRDELVRTGGPSNLAAFVDPDRAVRVLLDVVDNAFVHGEEPVEVTWSAVADQVRILVRDEGGPVPTADAERMFERFVQLGEMRHHSTGTGLGLPISRDLARAMGGDVWLDTAAATTTFVIEFPVVPADRPRTSPSATTADERQAEAGGGGGVAQDPADARGAGG